MSDARPPSRDPTNEVVVLIGYRGSGKTVVGRRLAERLGWSFIDTDEAVEKDAGRTIREIFETEGELAFRRHEADVLERALAGRRRVISAGGGAVLARRNRKALRSAGLCVWLTAPPEELHRRIAGDERSASQRPKLTNQPGPAEIEAVLQARLPIYEATADHVISTLGRSVEEVVEAILGALGVSPSAREESR
jgi:shikimate kinase